MAPGYDYYRAAQREKAKKRAASLAKTGEPIEFKIGEDVVTMTKQPMEYDYPGKGDETPCGQKFKAKYRVELNGVHRGWLVSNSGWGSSWTLYRLVKGDRSYYGSGDSVEIYSPQTKTSGDEVRQRFAGKVPDLVKGKLLGTLAEQAQWEKERAQERATRDRADNERIEGYRKERVAKNRNALRDLVDRAVALRGLLDRQVLTNYESEIIGQLLEENDTAIRTYEDRILKDGEKL